MVLGVGTVSASTIPDSELRICSVLLALNRVTERVMPSFVQADAMAT
jgi:hypothetical protein